MPRILLVEDDATLVELLRYNLEAEDYVVIHATDGEEALLLAEENAPDIILLDWMIPQLPGIEVCRRLRRAEKTAAIPIIMLTARVEESDRVRGLEVGADDYVTKPFSVRELMARLRAILRRSKPGVTSGILCAGGICLDLHAHKVMRGRDIISLGPKEFRLLRNFFENPRRVLSREQILNAVWGYNIYVEQRTVDVHIRRLRQALNPDGAFLDIIRTVRSVGYVMDFDVETVQDAEQASVRQA